MITNKNEVKTIKKHTSYDFNCKFNSTTHNSNQKPNNKACQVECKKDYNWNRSTWAHVFLSIASI